MSGLSPERLRAITYDMNTRPNVTITDRYHARELLAEVKRLREGIEALVKPRVVRDAISGDTHEIPRVHVRASHIRALLNTAPQESP